MDITAIGTIIGSLGFPIVMCLMMFDRLNKTDEQHKEEMGKMIESLNNNTVAITNLAAKLENTGAIK